MPCPCREAALATTAGFLGWTLDAFDFFLVVIALPRIAAEFHCKDSDIAWSLQLTLAFRPVGRTSSLGSWRTATAAASR